MTDQYTDADLERDIEARGLTAPRVTKESIAAKIRRAHFHRFPGTTVTVCALELQNGYAVVGHSAAASPANFDQAIGEALAEQHARDQIWALEGYLLRQHLHEQEAYERGG